MKTSVVWNMASILVVVIYSMVSMVMSHKGKGSGVPVVCEFSKTCVLPCSFTAGEELVLHWMFGPDEDQTVHSYYDGQNQLSHQDSKFKSRTSLFDEDLSRGNGSLRLTDVKVQDQGRYKCYTNTKHSGKQESFVKLTIEAPVRSIDIRLSDDVLTCSSEAIYPLPNLTWSPSLDSQPQVSPDAQGLYNICSSLRIMGNNTGVEYVCSVSSNTVTKTGTLRKQAPVESSPSSTASISCRLPMSHSNPLTFDLEWRFNHSELILTLSNEEAEPQIQGLWKDQVESSSEPGTLRLRKLKQSHKGTYTCDLRSAGNRYVSVTDLKILPEAEQDSAQQIGLAVGLGLFVVVAVSLVCCWCYHRGRKPACCTKTAASVSNGATRPSWNPEQATPLNTQATEEGRQLIVSNEMAEIPVDLSHPVTSTHPLMTEDSQDTLQHMNKLDDSDG